MSIFRSCHWITSFVYAIYFTIQTHHMRNLAVYAVYIKSPVCLCGVEKLCSLEFDLLFQYNKILLQRG